MGHDVFISYSRKDKDVVQKICQLFQEYGISYWLDKKDIHAGGEFLGDIANAIRQCKITLFISSSSSNNSMYTAKEVAMAFNEGKYIIPYKIDYSSFNRNLELVLCDLNWVEAVPFDDYKARELVSNIQSLLYGTRQQQIYDIPPRHYVNVDAWDEPKSGFMRYVKKIFTEK